MSNWLENQVADSSTRSAVEHTKSMLSPLSIVTFRFLFAVALDFHVSKSVE